MDTKYAGLRLSCHDDRRGAIRNGMIGAEFHQDIKQKGIMYKAGLETRGGNNKIKIKKPEAILRFELRSTGINIKTGCLNHWTIWPGNRVKKWLI